MFRRFWRGPPCFVFCPRYRTECVSAPGTLFCCCSGLRLPSFLFAPRCLFFRVGDSARDPPLARPSTCPCAFFPPACSPTFCRLAFPVFFPRSFVPPPSLTPAFYPPPSVAAPFLLGGCMPPTCEHTPPPLAQQLPRQLIRPNLHSFYPKKRRQNASPAPSTPPPTSGREKRNEQREEQPKPVRDQ